MPETPETPAGSTTLHNQDDPMNRKSIRSTSSRPIEKALPAAVHAAAMSLDGETAGAPAMPLNALQAAPHDLAEPGMAASADDGPDASAPPDRHTSDPYPSDPVADAPAPPSGKAPKPARPVKFSVSLPAATAQLFDQLRHGADGVKMKKSVVLRAALAALAQLDQEGIAHIVAGLAPAAPVARKALKSKRSKSTNSTNSSKSGNGSSSSKKSSKSRK